MDPVSKMAVQHQALARAGNAAGVRGAHAGGAWQQFQIGKGGENWYLTGVGNCPILGILVQTTNQLWCTHDGSMVLVYIS